MRERITRWLAVFWHTLALACLLAIPPTYVLSLLLSPAPLWAQVVVGLALGIVLGWLALVVAMQAEEYCLSDGMVLPFWMRRHHDNARWW